MVTLRGVHTFNDLLESLHNRNFAAQTALSQRLLAETSTLIMMKMRMMVVAMTMLMKMRMMAMTMVIKQYTAVA